MAFSWPWVGGDEIFYKLVHGGGNLYPGDRWEFGETIDALKGRAGRLLELGPGKGAFIHKLREAAGSRFDVVAADFDEGAVAELRATGITAIRGSLTDVAASNPEPFDVVCMFQAFEHMASTDQWFAELRSVMRPGGSVFLSVPHGPWITVQEELTGYWDMPPNHVGRWTQQAIDALAANAGFQVVEQRLMPVDIASWTRELAVWRVCGLAYKRGTLAQRIQSMTYRPVRGLLKQALAVAYLPTMFAKRDRFAPSVLLAHLQLSERVEQESTRIGRFVSVEGADLAGWTDSEPRLLRLAQLLAERLPRGKSRVPRALGRLFGRQWRTTIDVGGVRLAVDATNLDLYTSIRRGVAWEPWVLDACLELLRPGDVFLDIGANAGAVAVSVAARRRDVRVFAIEPQPQLARLIKISARLNGVDVQVLPVLLGNEDGLAELFVPGQATHASVVARAPGTPSITAPITTLDTLIANHTLPAPDTIKIDAEGSELDVFRGAGRLLREQSPAIVFEADENLERWGYRRCDLFDELSTAAPYTFYGLAAEGRSVIEDALNDPRVEEFVALPPGRA
jgi:FkbM family methyltransferase